MYYDDDNSAGSSFCFLRQSCKLTIVISSANFKLSISLPPFELHKSV
jgi:hypothetical protein